MYARHCEGPDCDTWQRTGSDLLAGFLTVTEVDDGSERHFCSWDCLLRFAATREPVSVVG